MQAKSISIQVNVGNSVADDLLVAYIKRGEYGVRYRVIVSYDTCKHSYYGDIFDLKSHLSILKEENVWLNKEIKYGIKEERKQYRIDLEYNRGDKKALKAAISAIENSAVNASA